MINLETLRNVPLFNTLPEQEILALQKIAVIHTCPAGEVVFFEDQPSESFLVILEGQVDVIKALGTQDEWKLAVIQQGEYIGEVGLFMKNQLRSASIRARSPLKYLDIPRDHFQAMLERQPALAFHIMQEMSQRLRSSENATIRDLRIKNQALKQALVDLKAAQSQLIAQERLEAELEAARDIQQGLLPKEMPDYPGWCFSAHWQPAREVSGDFYDFLHLPDGRLVVMVGDVTGKGMPAALVMANTRSVIHAVTGSLTEQECRAAEPGWYLARLNDLLCRDMPPKMFVTCLAIFIDPTSGLAQVANAGHCQPYLVDPGGCQLLRARGMPLGLFPGNDYEEIQVAIQPGQGLLLISDGLLEAHNPENEMFGLDRIEAVVNSLGRSPALPHHGEELIAHLLAEMSVFSGIDWEQEDDATLVTVDRCR